MYSLRPIGHAFRRILRSPSRDLKAIAVDEWEVAPASKRVTIPARCLPGQHDRIRAVEFGAREEVARHFRGGYEIHEQPTKAYRVENVQLIDGVLYGKGVIRHLRPRRRRLPIYAVPTEVISGTMYETWLGNRWFGSWLLDNCLTYPLAARLGPAITTTSSSGHRLQYERRAGMTPLHFERAHFRELVFFDDFSNNDDKERRADNFRNMLIRDLSTGSHPGVFILRGDAGDQRVLVNELAVAEHLAAKRGFVVIDPLKCSVDEIVRLCAGAHVIAGVEGSHLVHGLMVMPKNAALLVIQPPERVVSVLKLTTDRQGQLFSFVVASGTRREFSVDCNELLRTLDLVA